MERMLKNQKNKEDVISEIINSNVEIEMGASKYIAMLLMEDGYLLPNKIEIYKSFITKLYPFKVIEDPTLRVALMTLIMKPVVDKDLFTKLINTSTQVHTTIEIRRLIVNYAIFSI